MTSTEQSTETSTEQSTETSTEQTSTEQTSTEQTSTEQTGSKEAQYRTERNEAQARVEKLLTREADRVAGEHLAHGPDWRMDGATLSDLTGDDGDIDPAKVKAVCESVSGKRPGLERFRGETTRHGAGGDSGVNAYAREAGGMARTTSQWEAYDKENGVKSWAQSWTKQMKDGASATEVRNKTARDAGLR